MICDGVAENLSAYIDDELTPPEREAVEHHLAGCSGCQAELAALSAVADSVRALPPIPAPAGVDARAMALIQRRAAFAAPWRALDAALKQHGRTFAVAGGGLAAAAIALAVLPTHRGSIPVPTAPVPSIAAAPPPSTGPEVATQVARPPHRKGAVATFGSNGLRLNAPSPSDSGGSGPDVTPAQWDQIAAANADSLIQIDAEWRLYEDRTGKPVFQKLWRTSTGQTALAFVRLKSGQIVRWLTLDEDGGRNTPIHAQEYGEGFLADAQGDVLTSKRLVAGWTAPVDDAGGIATVFDEADVAKPPGKGVTIAAMKLGDAEAWIPETGGYLFAGAAPVRLGKDPYRFTGRNTKLSVTGQAMDDSADVRIAGLSAEADVARLVIRQRSGARPMELAQVQPRGGAQALLVLGGFSLEQWRLGQVLAQAENLGASAVVRTSSSTVQSRSQPPAPPSNDAVLGMVGRLEPPLGYPRSPAHSRIRVGSGQDVGSPVFGADGKVVGLLSQVPNPDGPDRAFVVTPIGYGLALLPPGAAKPER